MWKHLVVLYDKTSGDSISDVLINKKKSSQLCSFKEESVGKVRLLCTTLCHLTVKVAQSIPSINVGWAVWKATWGIDSSWWTDLGRYTSSSTRS